MYKDKDKQREANRLQMQRARAAKSNTKQPVGQSNTRIPRVTDQDFTKLMAQAGPGHVRVSKPGDADYVPQCETTKAFVEDRPKVKIEIVLPNSNQIEGLASAGLGDNPTGQDVNFSQDVVMPIKPKRGKDIKVFADLPPDVQQTIDTLSVVEGKMDQTIKANRTAIAIHYQHTFPGRY